MLTFKAIAAHRPEVVAVIKLPRVGFVDDRAQTIRLAPTDGHGLDLTPVVTHAANDAKLLSTVRAGGIIGPDRSPGRLERDTQCPGVIAELACKFVVVKAWADAPCAA